MAAILMAVAVGLLALGVAVMPWAWLSNNITIIHPLDRFVAVVTTFVALVLGTTGICMILK